MALLAPDVYIESLHQPFLTEETLMNWETPTAIDFRFGFEITMYIANR